MRRFDRNQKGTLPVITGNVCCSKKEPGLIWMFCYSGSDMWVDPCIIVTNCLCDFVLANQISECSDSSQRRLHKPFPSLSFQLRWLFCFISYLPFLPSWLGGSASVIAILLSIVSERLPEKNVLNYFWRACHSMLSYSWTSFTQKNTTPEGPNSHCHQAHNWCRAPREPGTRLLG